MRASILSIAVAAIIFTAAGPARAQTGSEAPFVSIAKSWMDAYNQKDAAAVANLYAEDAIQVAPNGIKRGRAEIQKNLQATIGTGRRYESITTVDPRIDGNTGWAIHEWKRVEADNGFAHVTYARVGNDWKIKVISVIPAPPPKK